MNLATFASPQLQATASRAATDARVDPYRYLAVVTKKRVVP